MHIASWCAVGHSARSRSDLGVRGPVRTPSLPDPRSDRKFTAGFDEVFRSDGIEIVRTPFRAPQANAVAERFVRTVRSECLDWLLVLNEGHLERVLKVFVNHYNEHRPHRALSLAPPEPRRSSVASATGEVRVHRRDRPRRCDSRVRTWRRDQVLAPYRAYAPNCIEYPAASSANSSPIRRSLCIVRVHCLRCVQRSASSGFTNVCVALRCLGALKQLASSVPLRNSADTNLQPRRVWARLIRALLRWSRLVVSVSIGGVLGAVLPDEQPNANAETPSITSLKEETATVIVETAFLPSRHIDGRRRPLSDCSIQPRQPFPLAAGRAADRCSAAGDPQPRGSYSPRLPVLANIACRAVRRRHHSRGPCRRE
jgi:hypothetical protein